MTTETETTARRLADWCDILMAIRANDARYKAEMDARGRATRATLREGERLTRRLTRATRAWDRATRAGV